jgi:hypothetical protein
MEEIMKLYAYELKLYTENPIIEIKAFGARENKSEYFSSTHELPVSAVKSMGGWYIEKNRIGKEVFDGCGGSYIYMIFLSDNKTNTAKVILKNKLAEIIERDKEKLRIKENLFNNLNKQ